MAGKEMELGPTSRTVADNVKRLRELKNLNYTELSDLIEQRASWSISAVGVRRIESGERRVSPDDLVALALALNVAPVTLMVDPATDADGSVTLTGVAEPVTARRLWQWMTGAKPLHENLPPREQFDRMAYTLPEWLAREEIQAMTESARLHWLAGELEAGGERAENAHQQLDEMGAAGRRDRGNG